LDLFRAQFGGDPFEGQMGCGQGDAQPPAPIVVAQEHHCGALRAGQFGEEFGLAYEWLAAARHGLLVQRRGDEGVDFTAQAALRSAGQPCHGRPRRHRRTRVQSRRQRLAQGIMQKVAAFCAEVRKWPQCKVQPQFFAGGGRVTGVANQQVARVVSFSLNRQRLERNFRANACDITQRNGDPARH